MFWGRKRKSVENVLGVGINFKGWIRGAVLPLNRIRNEIKIKKVSKDQGPRTKKRLLKIWSPKAEKSFYTPGEPFMSFAKYIDLPTTLLQAGLSERPL